MMSLEQILYRIAERFEATMNPDFSGRFEGVRDTSDLAGQTPPAGSILCILDASKMASISFYSGWEITVVRSPQVNDEASWALFINGVLVIEGIHRKNLGGIRGTVYRALIGRLRSAHNGTRGV